MTFSPPPGLLAETDAAAFLYEHEGALYLNITNRCPVACRFCVKQDWDYRFHGRDLSLAGREPSLSDMAEGLRRSLSTDHAYRELVFCGFGEPTMRLREVIGLARTAKELRPSLSVRLNTVGLGSLINGADIVPQLARELDAVSVSLNTADSAQWAKLLQPAPRYRRGGYKASRDFAKACVAAGLKTRVTAVELPEVDLGALRAYAVSIGAEFAARPMLK